MMTPMVFAVRGAERILEANLKAREKKLGHMH